MIDTSKVGSSLQRCGLCYTTQGSFPQGSECKATLYCSNHHQAEILPAHQPWCDEAAQVREEIQRVLGDSPVKLTTTGNPFVLTEYQRQQFGTKLDQTHSHQVCSKILDAINNACNVTFDQFYDCWERHSIRRRDDQGAVRKIPYGFLQIDKDQQCHDFIEWHSTVSEEHKSYWDGTHYHWNKRPYRKDNGNVPFLEDHWCDSMQSVKYLCIPLSTRVHHHASDEVARFIFAVHLKIKILLDLTGLHLCNTSRELLPDHIAPEIVHKIRYYIVESPLVANNQLIVNNEADLGPLIAELTTQLKALNRFMTRAKYWFWPILLAQIARINGQWGHPRRAGRPPPSGMEDIRIEGYCYDASSEMDSVPRLFHDITRDIVDCLTQQGSGFVPESTVESSEAVEGESGP